MYTTVICVIDPESYRVTKYVCKLTPKKFTNQDFISEFFKNWDKKDKYEKCYAIGIESINKV